MNNYKEHKAIADAVIVLLKEWGAYMYHEATTGSMYIKFPHWGLGSIRIGDHRGIGKYKYRWRVRTDMDKNYSKMFQQEKTLVTEVGIDKIDFLIHEFQEQAKSRGIRPGDKESWGGKMTKKKICYYTKNILLPVLIFLLVGGIVIGAVSYKLCVDNAEFVVIRPVLHTGTPPVATPVILFWVRPDGTVHSESAEYFDGIGMLPFSTTGSAVPYDIMRDWTAWVELDPRIGGLDGR